MERRDFNAAAATWDSNPHRVRLAVTVAETIMREVPLQERMRLLDYGCGTGLVTLALQSHVGLLYAVIALLGCLKS